MKIRCGNKELNAEAGMTVMQCLLALSVDTKGVLAVQQGGCVLELTDIVTRDGEIRPLTLRDEEGRRIYERSLRFVMLLAFRHLMPGQQVRIEYSQANDGGDEYLVIYFRPEFNYTDTGDRLAADLTPVVIEVPADGEIGPYCGGDGKCDKCGGEGTTRGQEVVEIKIPAGVDAGQSVRVRGEGCVGSNGGPNGDVLVEVYIKRHPIFMREGMDVLCEVPITFTQAALGAEIEVPTLDGKTPFTIPEGTQTGKEFFLSGKGIPQIGNPKRRGNQRFTVVVETPTKLTREQKELLRKLDDTLDVKASPKRKKFFDTVKDFFD